jgi:hypothetical protein
MARLIEMLSNKPKVTRTNVATEVEGKLQAARERLGDLEAQVSATALDAALGEQGAAERLVALNNQMDIARREVEQLAGAHRLALQRDARALAEARAKIRQSQLAAMQSHARARLEAMVELCTAIEVAAKAYGRFLDCTDKMAMATPTGMIPHAIMWHTLDMMIDGRAFPASIEVVVAGEMFRHRDERHADKKHGFLPGARPPTASQVLRPDVIEPATEGVKRMNEYLVSAIKDRLESIERADYSQIEQGNLPAAQPMEQ